SSRLLEYELWIRIYARRLYESHGESARPLIGRLALLELAPPVLARALEPFPAPVRTLDTLHLASIRVLRLRLRVLVVLRLGSFFLCDMTCVAHSFAINAGSLVCARSFPNR